MKNLLLIFGLIFCANLSLSAKEKAQSEIEIETISKGLTPDVAQIVERIVYCNHWLGEDPYNKDRKKDIDSALKEYKCATVEKDRTSILKKYSKDSKVKAAVENADNLFL